MELREVAERRAPREPLARPVLLVLMGLLERQALPAVMGHLAHPAPRGHLGWLGHQAHRGWQAPAAHPGAAAVRVPTAHLVRVELPDQVVLLVLALAHTELLQQQ